MTQITFGYFSEKTCKSLKEKLEGKTYMNFEISYSNCAGNCNLIVETRRPETTKEELNEMFMFVALEELARK